MAILNKREMACYIVNKYNREYHKDISPIKLQKSLYFLYGMWGGKIADAKLNNGQDIEDDRYKTYDVDLFVASFQAQKYGPVDEEIYIVQE